MRIDCELKSGFDEEIFRRSSQRENPDFAQFQFIS